MNRSAEITLNFGEGEYLFRLGIGELRQLQEKCGERGPMTILRALTDGSWLVDDIIQPIRLGLIGGGLKPEDAARIVRERMKDRPIAECLMFSIAIVQAAITGPAEEVIDPGQANPGKDREATGGSSSLPSTETEPSSDSPPGKSIN